MGRFLSLDPILGSPGVPQSWNRYAYVQGNPINFVDPFGLQKACSYTDADGNTQTGFCDVIDVTDFLNPDAEVETSLSRPSEVDIPGGDISEGPGEVGSTYRAAVQGELAGTLLPLSEGSYFSDQVMAGFLGVSQGTDMMEAFVLEVGYSFALGGALGLFGKLRPATLGRLRGMSLTEAKQLMSGWTRSNFDNVAESIRYHARSHGFGDDVAKYLRKAANFNKRGASKTITPNGAIRWNRKGGEFLIERAGKIVSYGVNQ